MVDSTQDMLAMHGLSRSQRMKAGRTNESIRAKNDLFFYLTIVERRTEHTTIGASTNRLVYFATVLLCIVILCVLCTFGPNVEQRMSMTLNKEKDYLTIDQSVDQFSCVHQAHQFILRIATEF